jgi:hypothetical protein
MIIGPNGTGKSTIRDRGREVEDVAPIGISDELLLDLISLVVVVVVLVLITPSSRTIASSSAPVLLST